MPLNKETKPNKTKPRKSYMKLDLVSMVDAAFAQTCVLHPASKKKIADIETADQKIKNCHLLIKIMLRYLKIITIILL